MILGVHISIAGSLAEAPQRASSLGCNAMQIFSRSPQSWRQGFLETEEIDSFKQKMKQYRIQQLFIHMPYLVNLASPVKPLQQASIKAYIEDIKEAYKLGADYIVTHMGSHKETNEFSGIKRFSSSLNTIIKKTEKFPVGILLENTSGSGSWLGYTFKHHKAVIKGLKNKQRVGLCVDTAHAYTAGYDLSTEEGLESMIAEIDKMVGTGLIKLIHLNDTKDKLGSHYDRHYHIGKGSIGIEGMSRIINHPQLRESAYILETPKKTARDDLMNLALVKKLRQYD
jgi:deoxyribonuclease IV